MKKCPVAASAGLIMLFSCSGEVLSPGDGLTEQERAELLALVEDLPFFRGDFGDDGVPVGANVQASFENAMTGGPQNWGRRRGQPVNQEIFRIETDVDNGFVVVTKELVFEGEFLVLDTETDQIVRKDLHETRRQTATFRRLAQAQADEESGLLHRWNLVAVSPAEYLATEAENRLVTIESVSVLVNGEVVMTITDPAEMIRVEDRMARFVKDSSVEIRVTVSNGTVDRFDPAATFVYLHLRYAAADVRVWRRMPMDYVAEVGAYVANWTVHHRGRERILVDALDAETVSTAADAPYYSNIWGIPYRTVILRDPAN